MIRKDAEFSHGCRGMHFRNQNGTWNRKTTTITSETDYSMNICLLTPREITTNIIDMFLRGDLVVRHQRIANGKFTAVKPSLNAIFK